MALSETDHTLLPGVSGNMLMAPGYHTRVNKEGTVLNHRDNIQHRKYLFISVYTWSVQYK